MNSKTKSTYRAPHLSAFLKNIFSRGRLNPVGSAEVRKDSDGVFSPVGGGASRAGAAHNSRGTGTGFHSRGRMEYEAVRRAAESGRRSAIERGTEDDQFRGAQRAQLLALIRNAYRNSPLPRALAMQRRLNIVGAVGGRLQLTTESAEYNAAASAYFRRWARNCEFTDGKSFNELLQLIVATVDAGGDAVVVHDAWTPAGGVICGSGKVRIFESDEIGSLNESDFAAAFPAGYTQRSGKVYDAFGRFVAVIVSASQRGQNTFSAEKGVIILTRDPDAAAEECPWVYLQDAWRPNQGRGVSPFAGSVDLLADYGDILASEAAAAKLNSQLFGAYKRGASAAEAESVLDDYAIDEIPDAVPTDPNAATVTGPEGESSAEMASVDEPMEFPDHVARQRGVMFDVLPDGYETQLYDTKRPNDKVADFLNLLAGQISATLGVGRTYCSLEPQSSYTAFRGAQLLARPAFVAAQKMLERTVCDWIAIRVLADAASVGLIPALPADAELYGSMVWSWPRSEEVDAVNEQNALALRLKNGAVTLREEFGPDWKQRIAQIAAEAKAMRDAGLIHPAAESASGMVITDGTVPETKPNEGNEI